MTSNGLTQDYSDLIEVDLGVVRMTRAERAFVWGAVVERQVAAKNVGVHFEWADFVRLALIEAAQR